MKKVMLLWLIGGCGVVSLIEKLKPRGKRRCSKQMAATWMWVLCVIKVLNTRKLKTLMKFGYTFSRLLIIST